MATKKEKSVPAQKATDAEAVATYMAALDHPLQAEINAVRTIIKNADSRIAERIKWNAPSYYYREDLVTFHTRAQQHVHLVFHHPAIVTIESPILQGDYKDRRMAYFKDMAEVETHRQELERILQYLVAYIERT